MSPLGSGSGNPPGGALAQGRKGTGVEVLAERKQLIPNAPPAGQTLPRPSHEEGFAKFYVNAIKEAFLDSGFYRKHNSIQLSYTLISLDEGGVGSCTRWLARNVASVANIPPLPLCKFAWMFSHLC